MNKNYYLDEYPNDKQKKEASEALDIRYSDDIESALFSIREKINTLAADIDKMSKSVNLGIITDENEYLDTTALNWVKDYSRFSKTDPKQHPIFTNATKIIEGQTQYIFKLESIIRCYVALYVYGRSYLETERFLKHREARERIVSELKKQIEENKTATTIKDVVETLQTSKETTKNTTNVVKGGGVIEQLDDFRVENTTNVQLDNKVLPFKCRYRCGYSAQNMVLLTPHYRTIHKDVYWKDYQKMQITKGRKIKLNNKTFKRDLDAANKEATEPA